MDLNDPSPPQRPLARLRPPPSQPAGGSDWQAAMQGRINNVEAVGEATGERSKERKFVIADSVEPLVQHCMAVTSHRRSSRSSRSAGTASPPRASPAAPFGGPPAPAVAAADATDAAAAAAVLGLASGSCRACAHRAASCARASLVA
ncbi:hypothetical protein TSOC_013715, partial [Tetrabaena socialis]